MSYATLFELPVTLLYPWCDFAHCLITALQARKDQKELFRYDKATQKRVKSTWISTPGIIQWPPSFWPYCSARLVLSSHTSSLVALTSFSPTSFDQVVPLIFLLISSSQGGGLFSPHRLPPRSLWPPWNRLLISDIVFFIDITRLLLTFYSTSRQTVDWNLSLGDSPLCALSTSCDIISSPAQHYGPLQGDLQAEKGERNYYFLDLYS